MYVSAKSPAAIIPITELFARPSARTLAGYLQPQAAPTPQLHRPGPRPHAASGDGPLPPPATR
ncbi:MAG: hypothetical protein QM755_08600 [Luteolibacter sp.]